MKKVYFFNTKTYRSVKIIQSFFRLIQRNILLMIIHLFTNFLNTFIIRKLILLSIIVLNRININSSTVINLCYFFILYLLYYYFCMTIINIISLKIQWVAKKINAFNIFKHCHLIKCHLAYKFTTWRSLIIFSQ